jgi:hypothetical protein
LFIGQLTTHWWSIRYSPLIHDVQDVVDDPQVAHGDWQLLHTLLIGCVGDGQSVKQ